jgi:hypothetical protein
MTKKMRYITALCMLKGFVVVVFSWKKYWITTDCNPILLYIGE